LQNKKFVLLFVHAVVSCDWRWRSRENAVHFR